ncbi:ATPase 7, plasma membrane-type-like [Apium graveolens]|uniref:ATPase 7, plasma membrane-type-like n=1 Tax=Apium graveolens TaxID=4045 RepID=UPI003D7A7B8C
MPEENVFWTLMGILDDYFDGYFSEELKESEIMTVIFALVTWDVAGIVKIIWKWAAIIRIYNILSYLLLVPIKFSVRYALGGRAWGLIFDNKESETELVYITSYCIHHLKGFWKRG